MIQAPQTQYIPAQQIPAVMPQNAVNPVQYSQTQTPGVIYNYPTASTYMPATTDRSQFNGVNIEIINPQGQGAVPNAMGCQMPAQYMPVQQPIMIPQYSMPYPASQATVQAPQYPQMPQQQIPAPQIQQIQTQQPQTQQPNVQTPNAAAPVVDTPSTAAPAIDPEAFAGRLATDDLDAQRAAIEEVADAIKNSGDAANGLLDTKIVDALTAIIDKDTSALEAPSPEIIELRQKPEDKLTPEEKEKASTPSPLEKAELNKQYSLYTLAYIQERLNNELVKQNGNVLEMKDLPAIEKVIDTVKSNKNPMLRVAGLEALSHIAKPEYKADLATIFELAKADEDAKVKETATKVAETLNKI